MSNKIFISKVETKRENNLSTFLLFVHFKQKKNFYFFDLLISCELIFSLLLTASFGSTAVKVKWKKGVFHEKKIWKKKAIISNCYYLLEQVGLFFSLFLSVLCWLLNIRINFRKRFDVVRDIFLPFQSYFAFFKILLRTLAMIAKR